MNRGLAIVSGGMDSITLLYKYCDEIEQVVAFDYGSKHNAKEIPFARYHAELLGKKFRLINLDFVNELFSSSLLKSGEEIPDGHYQDETMKSTVVPFRNGIMLAIACGYAESLELTEVYYGAHFGDHAIYPDCRESFYLPFKEAMKQGTYLNVELKSPFLNLQKRDIALIGQSLNIDWTKTWSCYKGQDIHCGTCGTCMERKEALCGFDSTIYNC